jgi:protoporphyrinogen oxidase
MTDVVILGAGPAGLGAALGLARNGYQVAVLEQGSHVGGNAGSFELAGLPVDYGSHRFHPAADPGVMALVRELLGDDLLTRPRHGRIRLLGRWIHFPLRPVDLAVRGNPRFTAGVIGDLVRKLVAGENHADRSHDTFASVLERGLGPTICRHFYFPYARKIWGLSPDEISPVQAYKRVSAGSLTTLLKRLTPRGSGTGARSSKGIFFYPRHGYGQISERLREAAEAAGARIALDTTVEGVERDRSGHHCVTARSADGSHAVTSRHLWSTVPLTTLARLMKPCPPAAVIAAASRLELRAMVLVYLVLDTDRFTEFDAHYFPGEELPFTRVSEPKNYSGRTDPAGVTVLCAEIPCARGSAIWTRDDQDLGAMVAQGLATAGLPVQRRILNVTVRRLPAAYPIYRRGYEEHFASLDAWVDSLDGVLSFGRQGLYAHDNTHHALFMARAAVECLQNGRVDRAKWREYRQVFARHVVED